MLQYILLLHIHMFSTIMMICVKHHASPAQVVDDLPTVDHPLGKKCRTSHHPFTSCCTYRWFPSPWTQNQLVEVPECTSFFIKCSCIFPYQNQCPQTPWNVIEPEQWVIPSPDRPPDWPRWTKRLLTLNCQSAPGPRGKAFVGEGLIHGLTKHDKDMTKPRKTHALKIVKGCERRVFFPKKWWPSWW